MSQGIFNNLEYWICISLHCFALYYMLLFFLWMTETSLHRGETILFTPCFASNSTHLRKQFVLFLCHVSSFYLHIPPSCPCGGVYMKYTKFSLMPSFFLSQSPSITLIFSLFFCNHHISSLWGNFFLLSSLWCLFTFGPSVFHSFFCV